MLARKQLVSIVLASIVIGAAHTSSAAAAQKRTFEQRLQQLERKLENKGLVDLLIRLENLQKEMQDLRGEVELQSHTLESIKKRQRDLYVDIDRRLLKIERGATMSSPPAADTAGSAKSDKDAAREQDSYQKAFDLLRELRYDKAIIAFRDFLREFPDGRYAHIAQYWMGEANYAQRKYRSAIKDYKALISRYPQTPKLAEAMLKIGYGYYELKDYKNASKSLESLIQTYPDTTEAGQARNLLKQIKLKT